MNDRIRRFCFIGISTGVSILLALFLLWTLIFGWGWNQALTVEYITESLHTGMSVREVEMGLAMPPGSISDHLQKYGQSMFCATVADSGIIGSFFVPQKSIIVVFDSDLRLNSCNAEMIWRADEYLIPCNISAINKGHSSVLGR